VNGGGEPQVKRTAFRVGLLLLGLGCGGGSSGPDPNAPLLAKASPSGDGQSGPAGTPLTEPLRVILTQAGAPLAGRSVSWTVLASGGSANPASSTSGADGIASTNVTLPPFAATSQVVASSSGANGSPLHFSVTSTGATSSATVRVVDNEFQPVSLQITAGGSVTFAWLGGAGPHNVTPVGPNTIPASSDPAPPGTHNAPYTFSTTFSTAGTFAYFCSVHGSPSSGMRGSVTVVP
jgi:plastocyanin